MIRRRCLPCTIDRQELILGYIDEVEYKKGVLLFYEQNNLSYFKTIFLDQFRQAIAKYF